MVATPFWVPEIDEGLPTGHEESECAEDFAPGLEEGLTWAYGDWVIGDELEELAAIESARSAL